MRYLRLTFVMIVFFGLGYPFLMTGICQILFPDQANGSMVMNTRNQVVGSALIGQSFQNPAYFHGRVSSIDYNAARSGSTNYAPSNKELIKRVQKDAQKWLKENPGKKISDIPTDLITNSGSGLDPHISPEAARFQIPRIARESGLRVEEVERLVRRYTEGKAWGIFGQPCVNVLKLNLGLQKMVEE